MSYSTPLHSSPSIAPIRCFDKDARFWPVAGRQSHARATNSIDIKEQFGVMAGVTAADAHEKSVRQVSSGTAPTLVLAARLCPITALRCANRF